MLGRSETLDEPCDHLAVILKGGNPLNTIKQKHTSWHFDGFPLKLNNWLLTELPINPDEKIRLIMIENYASRWNMVISCINYKNRDLTCVSTSELTLP